MFADVFNTYMYGDVVLQPEDLQPIDTAYAETVQQVKGVEVLGRYRDISRKATLGTQYVILGIENQDKVHYAMPLRVMLYDVLGYSAECKNLGATQESEKWTIDEFLSKLAKGTKITPIFTIIFYTGEKKWDGPCSLYEMLEIGDELKSFVPDYPIHVIDVGHDEIKFGTNALWELTCVLNAIYNKTIGQRKEKISNSILSLAGILLGTKGLYNMREEGETVMCEAMREMLEEGIQEGVQDAIEKLILKCLKKGHTCEEISDFNDIPLDEVKKVEEKYKTLKET